MNDPVALDATAQEMREELERLRFLHTIGQEFNSSLELEELLPKVFDSVLSATGAQGGSLWIAEGDMLRCRLALGASSQKLVDTTVPLGTGFVGDVARKQRTTIVTQAMQDPRFDQRVDRSSSMVTTTVMAAPMIAKGETVGAIQLVNKVTGVGIFDDHDRELLEGMAGLAAIALRNAQLHAAEKRARDLALLLEISREITSTLDLDRVLQSVVNLAARAFTFDRGAVALVDRNRWEVRAVAGEEVVDPKKPLMRRLAERGAWAADRGETLFLPDTDAALGGPETAFVAAFEPELREEELRSVLYLPLKDEEGVLGVLLFESRSPELASPTQRELAEILANQTTVALRNAQLYHQVPLADTWGALAARKRRFLALPRQRKILYLAALALSLAAVTLIRWPVRVSGEHPVFRAGSPTEVRALVPGVIDRVLVREGESVARGHPIVELRDPALLSTRETRAADVAGAEREAARAAARGDPAEERIQRVRLAGLEQELSLLDQEVATLTVRAPGAGIVLTPHPEERLGQSLAAGDPLIALGRTDTLTLEFGVDQRDIGWVQPGQRVRLRIEALPQRTFEGRVVSLGQLPVDSASTVRFPVRVAVPNPDGNLKPGMAADVRVLTRSSSLLGRLVRGPARWLQLFWWRIHP
jgi:GAF domain-containing protein/multidrug resistance efflux pump